MQDRTERINLEQVVAMCLLMWLCYTGANIPAIWLYLMPANYSGANFGLVAYQLDKYSHKHEVET